MKHGKVESQTEQPRDTLVPQESILITEELKRRPSRAPDYQTESRALVQLTQALADSPSTILQTMAETMLELFRCDSAGFSLLTKDEKSFFWPAIAGAWHPHLGGGTPRDFGPCGDVLDCNTPLLFSHWERRYPYLLSAMPLAEEGLLVPFYVEGKAVGTIWAIAHDNRRKFDAEDMRQLINLGSFASSAYQMVASLDALEQRDEELRQSCQVLEQRVVERTSQLTAVNEELRKEILERKRAEEELSERERRYRHIFQTAGVSIWEEDFSQVRAAIDDLKAQGVRNFRRYIAAHPEFVLQAFSMVKVIDVNDATVRLFEAQSKDELLVSLDKIFVLRTLEVFAGELVAIAEGRTSFESEAILQTLKGGKLTVLFTITFPPQPAKLDSVLVSIMDITERKQAEEELRNAQVELAHVARVMTMGELVASIAHEVNQPLGAIVTNGHACMRLLSRKEPALDKSREVIERMIKDGERASEVIKRIRELLHKTPPEKTLLNINETIQEVIALVSGDVLRCEVDLLAELAAELPPVIGDRIQLQQVILNLILNAKDAMSTLQSHPRELLVTSRRSQAGEAVVAVRDSGPGLDPKDADRIFDPFFTTKAGGMGLGLSISRTIIEAHGGTLWATQNEGKGATIQFMLPPGSASG